MAFTVDLTSAEGTTVPVDGINKCFVMRRTVDFTKTANQLAQTATMALFDIPAYILVREVYMVVTTADADVSDVDIGTFSTAGVAVSADGFIDGATIASTGIKRDVAGETYSINDGTAGYVAAAAWSVGLTNNDADTINGAVITFCAECVDLR